MFGFSNASTIEAGRVMVQVFYLRTRGWYWWSYFPGSEPDGAPCGPYATEAEALADALRVGGVN